MSSGTPLPRRSTRRHNARLDDEKSEGSMTPSRKMIETELPKTPTSAVKLLENGLTPRRSGRKSVKPPQDYEEIVLNKRVLRNINLEDGKEEQRWSPSTVGRTSQKRSVKKGRSGKKSKTGKSLRGAEESHSSEEIDNVESKYVPNGQKIANEDSLHTTCNADNEEKMITETETEKNEQLELIAEEKQLNTTFDKKVEAKLDDNLEIEQVEKENAIVAIIVEKGNEIVIEPQVNVTFEMYEEENQDAKKESKNTETNDEIDGKKLNATFDKEENEEKSENPNLIDRENEENHLIVSKATSDDIDSISSKHIDRKKPEAPVFKLLHEGNELGCTPILYDDDNLAEKENLILEKLLSEADENSKQVDADDDVFEENENERKEDSSINLISDDDESLCLELSDEDENKAAAAVNPNGTFNASDCVIISPPKVIIEKPDIQKNSILAQAQKKVNGIEEDNSTPNKVLKKALPEIILTNDVNVTKELNETPQVKEKSHSATTSAAKTRIPSSTTGLRKRQNIGGTPNKRPMGIVTPNKFFSDVTPSKRRMAITPNKRPIGGTPKKTVMFGTPHSTDKINKNHSSKIYRFPTPYKPQKDFHFTKDQDAEAAESASGNKSKVPPVILTTLEPREIVLRSIRKRSLSESSKGQKNVTFHSPANQTATIEDLDKIIKESAVKKSSNKKDWQNITRRKRSFSVDENVYAPPPSKLPRPVRFSPQNPKSTTVRTVVPNFAAIHQKLFEKMENLQDFMARKEERAKILTNSERKVQNLPSTSTTKPKPNAAKTLALTSSNKENASKAFTFHSCWKNAANEKQSSTMLTRNQEKQSSSVLKKTKGVEDKLQKRTQNHIGMFKSCPLEPKITTNRNKEIIRGVRSNRRFELMMRHREIEDSK